MRSNSTTKRIGKVIPRQCETCGETFTTWPSRVYVGKAKYCSRDCAYFSSRTLPDRINRGGRIFVRTPDGRMMREHRYVMERHLGRPLDSTEVVHHIDGDPLNNDVSNLQVMSQSDHVRIHKAQQRQYEWSPNYPCCVNCGTVDRPCYAYGYCKNCYRRKLRKDERNARKS